MKNQVMRMSVGLMALVLVGLASCESEKKACQSPADLGKTPKPVVKINRLEQALTRCQNGEEVRALVYAQPLFARHYLQIDQLPHDSIAVNDLNKLRSSPFLDTMNKDVQKNFADLSWLENEYTEAFQHLKYYYPQAHIPQVATLVTGFSTDLYADDSLVVVGLECYQFDKGYYTIPTQFMPRYIARRMVAENIVPSTLMALSNGYNMANDLDQTMLKEMIQWGKAYYFMKALQPCKHDSTIIGFTGQELAESRYNIESIWEHFVANKLFFETNHMTINRYVSERPKTFEIGQNCPGRIGRWLGWLIVEKWAEEKGLSLPEVMAEKDAQKIFRESKFRPERPKN